MPKEICVTLEDKKGTLAALAEALGKAGVNIDTFAVVPGAKGNCRILVSDGGGARKAIEAAGMTVEGDREVLVTELADRAGELGRAARKLADAGINIDAAYVASQYGGRTKIVFSVADPAKARAALGN